MGDPGCRNLFDLMTEVRAQRVTGTDLNGSEDDDSSDDEEEGGNWGDRRSVAFPRVAGEQEVLDASKQEGSLPPPALLTELKCRFVLVFTDPRLSTTCSGN